MLIVYEGLHFVELSFIQMEGSSDPGGLPYRFIVKSLMPLGFIFLIMQAVKEVLTCKEELTK
jgi:TRAP-type mannitol/chloroaromatic compound transport system permease small subunit